MKNLTLSIAGMHCDACVRRVSHALQSTNGVTPGSVKVGSAVLSYDPAKTSPEAIAAAVDRIGFQATPRP